LLALHDGILIYIGSHKENDNPARIVVPKTMQRQIVAYFHSGLATGAHRGFEKVYDALRRRFWWKGQFQSVTTYVASCEECQRTKMSHQKPAGAPLTPHAIPAPFEHVAMYFVGPLPVSIHGNRYILVITDYFTRWVEAYATADQSADVTAVCLGDWCTRYGSPLGLHSDRGGAFLSEVVRKFNLIWDVKPILTSSYHPQANGLVERMNGTLCDMLRAFATDSGRTWDEVINAALFVYRTTVHSGIDNSPDMLTYGFHLRTPLDTQIDQFLQATGLAVDDHDFLSRHISALKRAR
jgi:transposase InsO family protein